MYNSNMSLIIEGLHKQPVDEGGEFEFSWQEIGKNDKITSKRKAFKSKDARDKFLEKLYDKDNLYQVLGTRDPEE